MNPFFLVSPSLITTLYYVSDVIKKIMFLQSILHLILDFCYLLANSFSQLSQSTPVEWERLAIIIYISSGNCNPLSIRLNNSFIEAKADFIIFQAEHFYECMNTTCPRNSDGNRDFDSMPNSDGSKTIWCQFYIDDLNTAKVGRKEQRAT